MTGSIVGYEEPRYTYSGISLLSPELFESLKPVAKEFPLRDILRTAILASRVSGEVLRETGVMLVPLKDITL